MIWDYKAIKVLVPGIVMYFVHFTLWTLEPVSVAINSLALSLKILH